MMHITFRAHLLDPFEARARQPPREYYVCLQAAIGQLVYSSKDHPHLKAYTRFGRRNLDGTALLHERIEPFEEQHRWRALTGQKVFDGIAPARVRHIAHNEFAAAFRAGPKRAGRYGRIAG